MSDTVQIITAVLAFLSTVFVGVMTYLTLKLNKKNDKIAEDVKGVHRLVNSDRAVTLEALAVALRTIANNSPTAANQAAAAAAEKASLEQAGRANL